MLGSAAAQLGAVVAEARTRIARAPRVGQLGPRRAALARCRNLAAPLDDAQLAVIGARAAAPHVSALARVALALRLPRTIGAPVLAALVVGARADVATGPAWAALAA